MTPEEKLDEALKYLSTHDAKGASFDYYDKRGADGNKKEEYLFKYLLEIGIDENEMMPIIYHLYGDKYIDANWQEKEVPKESGQPPNQIKITWEGRIFIERGGYTKQIAMVNKDEEIRISELERIQKMDDRSHRNATRTVKLTRWIAFGTLIAALYYLNEMCWKYQWFCFCK